VNQSFNTHFTPILFGVLVCEGSARHTTLQELACSNNIAQRVRSLQLSISPEDFGAEELSRFQERCSRDIASHDVHTMDPYFQTLESYLIPLLARFTNLRTLNLNVDYAGIPTQLYSANKLIAPCLTTLMRCVKESALVELEELKLGMLYHGGYSNFFSASEVGLDKLEKRPRSVSIKLSDGWGNFTLMPVPK